MRRFRPRNTSYWLSQLYEANYRQLLDLLPELADLDQDAVAMAQGTPPLYLKVLERNPYTLTLELSHSFGLDRRRLFEPELCVRVYLDGRCAEVLSDDAKGIAYGKRPPAAVLEQKWASNYFLQRWLAHCARSRYRFSVVSERTAPSELA